MFFFGKEIGINELRPGKIETTKLSEKIRHPKTGVRELL